MIKISIVIIVKNDQEVFTTIDHLLELMKDSTTEIIVVDASQGRLINKYKAVRTIEWIEFKNHSNKKITIPEQRNVGINHARGEVIVFIDANCKPDSNWLQQITKAILEGDESIVAGKILSANNDKYHDRQDSFISRNKCLSEAPTMNLAFKKSIINKIGYFDETFDYGSDVDWTLRSTENGYKILYNREAVIYHNWGDLNNELKRAFRYGEARVNIYKKRKNRLITLVKKDPISFIYPLYLLFLPIIFIWPLYLAFVFLPLVKNRNYQPLKTTLLNFIYGAGILYKLVKSI